LTAGSAPLVVVSDLCVELTSGRPVVQDVSLSIAAGETLGIAGESGSGKTTTGLALLGYARAGMRIASGTVTLGGLPVAYSDERMARRMRGRVISHVPQDPATSLNPSLRIGGFIRDMLAERARAAEADTAVLSALASVQLPATRDFARRFPHQLSGGQQQRVLIASALVQGPQVVVLDEPTTGLDVITQARVLDEIAHLRSERSIAMVYVSHDLAVISRLADRIAVMYAGRIVEEGPTDAVLARPRHPYTRGLVAAIPDHALPKQLVGIGGVAVGLDDRPTGCAFAPRCRQRVGRCERDMPELAAVGHQRVVRCFEAERTPQLDHGEPLTARVSTEPRPLLSVERLTAVHRGHREPVVAASEVSFTVARSECVALVGESGSGKTTIARAIAGLHPPASGRITLDGQPLASSAKRRPRDIRRRCQMIFQNPYESLNPRRAVGEQIARPARILLGLSRADADAKAAALLERVRLPARLVHTYPSELSGGERQRVAIARALAADPEVVICDEITSALDVSVQAAVIGLLGEIRTELDVALLFITHNLGVVASIGDRVLVLEHGRIVEEGAVSRVFAEPQHAYTRELLEAAPSLQPR
jgi:peptide/nickel transport system ATP-binding protein